MAKFCTQCGKALEEGEICSCQMAEKKNEEGPQNVSGQQENMKRPEENPGRLGQQKPPQSQFEKNAAAFAKNFFKKILAIVKDPVTAGKEAIMETDIKNPLLMMALQGIFSAIFVMSAEGRLMIEFDISTPYFRIFIVTLLLSVGLACVLALLLKLGNAVIKIPVSYTQMLSAVSIRSALLMPAIILSFIVSLIHMGAGLVMFVLINIWGFTAMVVAMSSLIEQEKLSKFALAVSVVILLYIILTVFMLTRTVKFYIPDEIRTLISNLNDIGDILSWL